MCANAILARYKRPPIPWSIKSQLMGVPGSSTGDVFHAWAQLPIPREQYAAELAVEQSRAFPMCRPMPGAERLLSTLTHKAKVEVALASSSVVASFEKKAAGKEVKELLDLIPEGRRVLVDNNVMKAAERELGRKVQGKPAPDIFLIALGSINASLPDGVREIKSDECLVFEDSLAGVEAGRRAGMRVVWVPHPNLAVGTLVNGEEDGQILRLGSLEEFEFAKYSIDVGHEASL